jgi:hypothetical protein
LGPDFKASTQEPNPPLFKNVLAAGRASIEAKGETYEVAEPEVIDAAGAFPLLDERRRRAWRRFGIERFLRAKVVRRDP